ncbi:MAG TPA: GspMb/PilO family protein, partial [Gemmatimonadaceae bacterium]|nr:GspMb/PilO family protein [Gemmatimonadaceae bacterium]
MSPKDLRTLVTGSALVMAIVGTGKGVPAFRAWETARLSAAAEVRLQLDDAYGGATELRVLRDSARVRAARLDSVSVHLLSAQSADAAAGALASLVQTLAQAQGLDVLTLTLNPDTVVHAGLARVTVRLTAQGDVAGLMDFLLEVETHDTL